MKSVYLENTNNHHDKFYHMIENKDGVSFTASWGRTGSNGRTQVYSMQEWDKIYDSKISKGYIVSSNGIQGMSVAQRKKQGITTVQPLVRPKDVKVDHSHYKKLQVLSSTMNNWEKNNGRLPMDSQRGRMFESDLSRVMDLMKDGLSTEGKDYLTKKEMLEMNILFKTYGGKHKTMDTYNGNA